MRQLLREDDWTTTELGLAAGCARSVANNLIQRELLNGNVEFVGYKRKVGARSNLYTWIGDDDLIAMTKRAADYLAEHAQDSLGKSIANHLLRMTA
jgi:predicted transcriptional regulator